MSGNRVEQLTLRGLSERLVGRYLEKLGARETTSGELVATGWAASLSVEEARVGVLTLDEVRVRFEGEPEAVTRAVAALRKMSVRGGG